MGYQKVAGLLSLAALAVLSGGLPAVAQNVENVSTQEFQLSGSESSPESTVQRVNPSAASNSGQNQEQFSAATQSTPFPGTVETSSAALTTPSPDATSQPSAPTVAQADLGIARPTRGGSSYVGLAANIGISGGESSIGDGNFMVISKIGFTNALSVRPSAVFGDNTTILVPLTYDFSFQQFGDPFSEQLPIAPYVGAGAAINTGDNSNVAFLLSGGIDVPLNTQFTATAAVNAAFFDETDIGLMIGVGYNFQGFGF